MDPGDHWESEIHVQNNSRKDLEISLLEIINKLPESVLLDIMNLQIVLFDGTVLYNGKYSKTGKPVFPWIPLKPGQELCLIIHTGFPEEAGNEFQGRKFDTNWVFQVRAEEDQTPLAYYSNRSSIVITFVKTPLYSLCFNPNVVIKVLYIDIFGDTNSLIRSGLLRRTL